MVFEISSFIVSIFILSWLSSRLVSTLVNIAKYLHWREFIIAFFIMAFAGALPNLFVDINAALHHLPQISLGDILGGNLVDLTLVIAVAVLFSPSSLSAESRMVQNSAFFTAAVTLLPIFLIWDGKLDRIDGVILLGIFAFYVGWLFSKEERFKKVYDGHSQEQKKNIFWLLFEIVKTIVFLVLLLTASYFIINTTQYLSTKLGISLSLVAILIVGLGNCFPEMYFSIISARRGENWMILGDLMGSVIICATLVLGLIALFFPFQINDLSSFLITRVFTVIASLLFIVFIRTGKKITKTEGAFFLFIYILFLLTEIFFSQ